VVRLSVGTGIFLSPSLTRSIYKGTERDR